MKRVFSGSSRAIHQVTISAVIAASFLLLAGPIHAISVAQKKRLSLEQYHKALQMREALNGRPEAQRTPEDFDRVIEAFRKVYHVAPTSSRADASVLAVGDLLTEKARLENDEKGFQSAIGQYEFLAREYPGSKYRFEALLSIGQIYREDLGDDDSARAAFGEFVKRYPYHPLVENAKAALREMDDEANHPTRKGNEKDQVASAKRHENPREPKDDDEDAQPEAVKTSTTQHRGLPLVTSLRYWSTPDYTRIAIDVGDEIKYEAGRVPSPDRIYFDLYGSRLASELVGKSYNIQDGLLKKVRVAQYKPNMARVVLEVDNLAEYSAFLLPNPYRLIIDVHGKKPAPKIETAKVQESVSDAPSNSLTGVPQSRTSKRQQPKGAVAAKGEDSNLPTSAPAEDRNVVAVSTKPQLPPRAEVPLQSSDLGLAEIVALSEDPQQVKATSKPTSGPVVESVAKRQTQKIIVEENDTPAAPPTSTKITRKTGKGKAVVAASNVHAAAPTADGDLSLIRALGLKIGRIVVDAGHGGHDTGTIGSNGLLEKDLVLDVALRLGKLLEQKLGAEVVYTRRDDT
ncbi:MAG TPA: N-acetylmuramoyl-L-alanine amidase, partial [Terriglobales bacterium]|nr:N-acetylmuramoyl-L-alanine amidase [Terriglobales bacterium]